VEPSEYSIAAMLSFAGSKKPGAVSGSGPVALAVQASLVAGTGFEPFGRFASSPFRF
jgi:hypothetical protein